MIATTIRNRVLNPSIKLGEALLRERKSNDSFPNRERTTDSKRVTHAPTHAGRRTAITWWAGAGYDERDVMMWVGHEDPVLTLRLYRQARNRPRDPRGRGDVRGARQAAPSASSCTGGMNGEALRSPWHQPGQRSHRPHRVSRGRPQEFGDGVDPVPKNPAIEGHARGIRGFAKRHSCAKSRVGLLIVARRSRVRIPSPTLSTDTSRRARCPHEERNGPLFGSTTQSAPVPNTVANPQLGRAAPVPFRPQPGSSGSG